MAPHPHAHRLVYALDDNFAGCRDFKGAYAQAATSLERTLEALRDTGVTIKGNSVFRLLGGVSLFTVVEAGCEIFADYKLFDVQSTIANDGSWLRLVPNLKILTVSEQVHPIVFEKLAQQLPHTIIAPINPLTDSSDAEFKRRGEVDRATATRNFFDRVSELGARGIICSPNNIERMPPELRQRQTKICPAIRPAWAAVPGDTNAVNALTHQNAIRAGTDVLVIGSPLRYNNDLRGNTLRVLDEIGELLEGERG